MKIILTIVIFITLGTNCQTAGTQTKSINKSGLNPPKSLEIFEPNVISNLSHWTFTPSLSKDMQTLCFVGWQNPDLSRNQTTIQKLYKSRIIDGKWTEPFEVQETLGYRVDWCHFSPDGKYFLVSFAKPHEKHYKFPNKKDFDDFDIWIAPSSEKGEIDWQNFRPITSGDINRTKTPENKSYGYVHNETAPRMDEKGNLYFWTERLDDGGGQRDIYFAPIKNADQSEWHQAKILPTPINSAYRESGVAVSRSGKWIIFSSARPGGFGGEDLYFSAKITDEKWTDPINLGAQVNSERDEIVPELSPDGVTLYFSSNRQVKNQKAIEDQSGNDDFWVIYRIAVKSLALPID